MTPCFWHGVIKARCRHITPMWNSIRRSSVRFCATARGVLGSSGLWQRSCYYSRLAWADFTYAR